MCHLYLFLTDIPPLLYRRRQSVEFFTVKLELPARGDNTLAKKADRSYAKVLTHDAIGLSGVSALWIFGNP